MSDDLFRKKCKLCIGKLSVDPASPFGTAKQGVLKEILSALDNSSFPLTNDVPNWEAAATLIAAHIFRFPNSIPAEWFSFFDYFALSDICHDPTWAHRSLAYDIGVTFVKRMRADDEPKIQICGEFLKLAVYLARTPDDREQQKVVLFFLAIYEKVVELRPFAWQVVSSALLRILYDDGPFVAAKPILGALATVITGFKRPLNSKHRPFFHGILMPLHRNQYLVYFAKELLLCVRQYLEKDGSLVLSVFQTVRRFWPHIQSPKQLVMLDEIALFSSFVEEQWLVECVRVVCPLLLCAMTSCNAWVSEKVLGMWEINDFVWFMTIRPVITFPIIVPTIYEVARSYDSPEVRSLATAVLRTIQLNDGRAFELIGKSLTTIQSIELMKMADRAANWKWLISNDEGDRRERTRKLMMLSTLFEGYERVEALRDGNGSAS
jgi:serine/threonine-protein phosphatase 2A regulatory subunit B'